MKRKKVSILIGVIFLALIIGVMPFAGACPAPEEEPTPTPTPTPTPAPTPTPTPPAPEEETWTLMGESAWSAGLVLQNEPHLHHIDLIDKYTNGRVQVEFHTAPELVGAMELYGTVKEGGLDYGFACPCYIKGLSYAAAMWCDAPGGQSPREEMCWYWIGGGKELFEELVVKHANAMPFPSVQNTSEVWLFSNKEINTLDDLKGMKIRAAGTRCDVMNYVGGAAVTMAGGDIVPNLEKGVIDAAEYASIYATQAVGLDEITKYAYWHPYKSTSSFWLMFINNDVYNEFPPEIKMALEDAAYDNHLWSLAWGYIVELEAMKKSVEDFGTEMLYMPPAVIEEFDKAARDWYRDKAEEDAEVAMVLDSWDAFKADYGPYAKWLDIVDVTSWFGLWEEDVSPWYEPVEWPTPK